MTADIANLPAEAANRAIAERRLDALIADSRRPAFRRAAWLVMALVACFFGWAGFAQLDEVAIAAGEVVPFERTKIVQHLEGGIVQRLDVAEGDRVETGQVLMQLDLGGVAPSREEFQVQLDSLLLALARLRSESTGQALGFPEEVAARRPVFLAAERETYAARQTELRSRQAVIAEQIRQRELEVKELEARLRSVLASLKLGEERLKMSGDLLESGLMPRMEHLAMKREIEDFSGQATVLDQAIPRARAALAESQARLTEENEVFRRRAVEEISKTELQIARVREALAEASDRVRRTEIRSPIDGIVKNIRFTTLGGVIRPGEPIMEIVPTGDRLVIDARLDPVDRGYVAEGQRAVVKISTYDFVRYGGLEGVVARIAADTNVDPTNGRAYYRVVVETDRTYLGERADEFPITPGMLATVDIHTGGRSVLNYLVKPVLKLRHEAFRER